MSVLPCHDTTGQGFYNLVRSNLLSNSIDFKKCIGDSTDGAASMQGEYKGFSTKMKSENCEHVHIWCHSHILNLVISDLLKSHIKAATLFCLLNSVSLFFKESYQRMHIWCTTSTDTKKRKLQSIGETRWWAKEAALRKIFGSVENPDSGLFIDVIESLQTIANDIRSSPEARVASKNFINELLKYENILLAHIFLKIFSITGPLSRYLQTKGLDLLRCNSMVENTIKQIQLLQRDMKAIEEETDSFISWAANHLESREITADLEIGDTFPEKRSRRVKKFFDEKATDEQPKSEKDRFKISVYNVLLDSVIESMERRFKKNTDLCKYLALLNPVNFSEIESESLPRDSMTFLSQKIKNFCPEAEATLEKLTEELKSFSANWKHLKLTVKEIYEENDFVLLTDSDDPDDHHDKRETACNVTSSCQNCALCCYVALLKYNLYQEAYPTLACAYQYLLTLPITQVACERSFSILKYIKNRLRNRLSHEKLDSFMLMAIEKELLQQIDNEAVINRIAAGSNLMKKALMY